MKSTSAILGIALCSGCWLLMVFGGCSGPQVQQTEASDVPSSSQRPATVNESQLNPLLTTVSQLQIASQEALDAAKQVGTSDHELAEASQFFAWAEQLFQDGKAAYMARQYAHSWDKFHAADAAFRRAEESAVRAGLGQLERELAADFGRRLGPQAGSGRGATNAVRVNQGDLSLRDGAGANFRVIGKAHLGDILHILAESEEWYRVRTGTGLVGWVSKMSVTRMPIP
jgi:Bacterial SH3 domain